MAKKTGFLVGAILGALAGAAAALATAPKEGKKLRQDVKDFYQDYKEDPKAKFDDLKNQKLKLNVQRKKESIFKKKNQVNWLNFQLRNTMISEKNLIMAISQLKKQKIS